MTWKPIRNHEDEVRVVARMKELDSQEIIPGSPEADEMELLCILIDHYNQSMEEKQAVPAKDIIEMIMHEHDLSRSDLEPYLGSKGRISDILRGKRGLSLGQMRKLHANFGIPYEVMIESTPEESDDQKEMSSAQVFETQKLALQSAILMAMHGSQRRPEKNLFKVVHAPPHGQVWLSATRSIPKGYIFAIDPESTRKAQAHLAEWRAEPDQPESMPFVIGYHGTDAQTRGMLSVINTVVSMSKTMGSDRFDAIPSWMGFNMGGEAFHDSTTDGDNYRLLRWMGEVSGYGKSDVVSQSGWSVQIAGTDVHERGETVARDP